jgi:hypothetical protein
MFDLRLDPFTKVRIGGSGQHDRIGRSQRRGHQHVKKRGAHAACSMEVDMTPAVAGKVCTETALIGVGLADLQISVYM